MQPSASAQRPHEPALNGADDRTAAPSAAPSLAAPSLAAPSLEQLGWTADRAAAFEPLAARGLLPGRVCGIDRDMTSAWTGRGPVQVILQRRFRRSAGGPAALPVVGDWLALEPIADQPGLAALREVLPRRSCLVRADAASARPDARVDEQALAANVDTALIVSAFGHDLNLRRTERYLALAWSGGVQPVIVLNKSDLCADVDAAIERLVDVTRGVPVCAVSALRRDGLAALEAHLAPGTTACLLGSSGVGKSTLGNALVGESRQRVGGVRADDERGRHTTSRRELIVLPGGALLVDTPGLRSVGLTDDAAGLEHVFEDIDGLAELCRFSDCRHVGEPGCAVLAAVGSGELTVERLESSRRPERETRSMAMRGDARQARAESRRLGRIHREASRAIARKGWEDA